MSFAKSFARRAVSHVPYKGANAFVIEETELAEKYVIRHQYDPQSTLTNMFSFKGTVVEMVIAKKHFWLLIVKHILLFVGWSYASMETKEELHEFWNLRQGLISTLGSLVVFTIVFYTGNCYTTYKSLFNFGVDVHTNILVLASHMKAMLQNGDDVWASCRFLLAAQRVFYYDVQEQLAKYNGLKEGDEGFPPPWTEWSMMNLIKLNILTTKEAEVVKGYAGDRPSLLISWGEAAFIEHTRGNPHHDALSAPAQSQYLSRYMTGCEKLQDLLMSTTHAKEFGVPFVYHHIVHITCTFYLVLQSVGSLFVGGEIEICYWSLITYPIICFVMLGILCAADAMADPFGDDDCDFNLNALTTKLHNGIVHLCSAPDRDVVENIIIQRDALRSAQRASQGGGFSPTLLTPADSPSWMTSASSEAPAGTSELAPKQGPGGGAVRRVPMGTDASKRHGNGPPGPLLPRSGGAGSPLLAQKLPRAGSDGFDDPIRKSPRSPRERERPKEFIAKTQAQLAFAMGSEKARGTSARNLSVSPGPNTSQYSHTFSV